MKSIHALCATLCILLSGHAYGQEYAISNIPEGLLENADAVVRKEIGKYEISNLTSAKFTFVKAITIMNGNAKSLAKFQTWYDKYIKITSWDAKIFDRNGNFVKKFKNSDLVDVAITSAAEFDDSRILYLDMSYKDYPFTIEISYESKRSNLFYTTNWYTLQRSNTSIQYSEYEIKGPEDLLPKYKLLNTDITPEVRNQDGMVSNLFTFENLAAVEREPYGPYLSETWPAILVSPSQFNFDGQKGNFDTWQDFAKWISKLNQGRQDLSEETKAEIRSLTANMNSNTEKIKAVYEYMQNKTRYVSIQLGIGGFQPFLASEVDNLGYGDCKALSNYTLSLLDAIDIPSLYSIIEGGNYPDPVYDDFVNNPFNHAVLCVPNEGDTVWLECTSQTNPFGYQGRFTGDRRALVITEDGGQLVNTTVYSKEDNQQIITAEVTIDADGQASAVVNARYSGLQHENGKLNFMINKDDDQQKKWVLENTNIPKFDLIDFDFTLQKSMVPYIDEELKLTLPDYGQTSDTRLFIPLNLLNRQTYVPKRIAERATKVILTEDHLDHDTIVYNIPETIHPEFIPEPIHIENQFGVYHAEVFVESGKVTYVRRFEKNKGQYPKESYAEFRSFIKKIKKADKVKMVFLKST